MKKLICLLIFLNCLVGCTKEDVILDVPPCSNIEPTDFPFHNKATEIDKLISKYVGMGVPGISVALYHPSDGLYIGAAGNITCLYSAASMFLRSLSAAFQSCFSKGSSCAIFFFAIMLLVFSFQVILILFILNFMVISRKGKNIY